MNSSQALKAMKLATTPEKRTHFTRIYKEAKLRESIESCQRCEAYTQHGTPLSLSGSAYNPVRFVIHRPDGWDKRREQLMAGRSGSIFRSTAIRSGFRSDEASIMAQVACSDPKGKYPDSAERCRKHYKAQLGNAWLVALIGRDTFAHQFPEGTFRAGTFTWHDGRVWYSMEGLDFYENHPIELLNELVSLKELMRGKELPLPRKIETFMVGGRDIAVKIRNQGWAHIWLHNVERDVLITKDNETFPPEKYRDVPHFTLDEIVKMKGMGKDAWQNVLLVKELIGGTVWA